MRATTKFGAIVLALALATTPAHAQWLRAPTAEDLAAAYPPAALQGNIGGLVVLSCVLSKAGELSDCTVDQEQPADQAFGQAALSLTPTFRLDMASAVGIAASGKRIKVPIRFGPQPANPPRREAAFKDPGSYRHLAPAGPYWPERAERMGVSGAVVADCAVAANGRLGPCRIISEAPGNFGFSDSVLKMASTGFMTAGPAPEGVAPPSDGVWRFRVEYINPGSRRR